MPRTFLAPPGWPTPPPGWAPPTDWHPDPSWPPAPEGWVWWSEPPVAATVPYGFQPTPPPAGFAAPFGAPLQAAPAYPASAHSASAYAPPTQVPAPYGTAVSAPTYAPPTYGAPASTPAYVPSVPVFGDVADGVRRDARRRMIVGACWLLGGLGVTLLTLLLLPHGGGRIFFGAVIVGVVHLVRGAVEHARADRTALERMQSGYR